MIITLNAKFISYFRSLLQTLCILGYCIFPVIIGGAIVLIFIPANIALIVKLGICLGAFFWSSSSSISFIGDIVKDDKKLLAVFPIYLFFFGCCYLLASI